MRRTVEIVSSLPGRVPCALSAGCLYSYLSSIERGHGDRVDLGGSQSGDRSENKLESHVCYWSLRAKVEYYKYARMVESDAIRVSDRAIRECQGQKVRSSCPRERVSVYYEKTEGAMRTKGVSKGSWVEAEEKSKPQGRRTPYEAGRARSIRSSGGHYTSLPEPTCGFVSEYFCIS